jgi:hypothetical protein
VIPGRDVPSPAMTFRDPSSVLARRELVLVATVLVAMARLVARQDAFLVAILVPVAVLLAGVSVLRSEERPGRPVESLLVPAVLAGGASAAIHLVPAGLGLVPALALFALAMDWILGLETRLMVQATGTTEADRARILAAAVLAAFVAFTGVAALVPGGLPEPGAAGSGTAASATALTEGWLVVLALADAIVAMVLGYRVAAVRYGNARNAARSALTYAIVIAVAAGALRAMDVPRLVGPAALTLVFYLWDALHATAPARRREPRFLWETLLLAVLAVVVVAWNLRLRA